MDVSIESTGSILRRMTVVVPAEKLEDQIISRMVHLEKTLKLPGFRPGKVPRKVVESRFLGQVLQESVQELIDSSYREAVTEQNITPAGYPSIEPKNINRGENLEYVATFEVFPTINKLSVQDQQIEKTICVVGDDDIDRTIETLRRQHTEWKPKDTTADTGDRLLISFVGTIDGEPFEGGEVSDYPVILGQGGILPEFEDGLSGKKTGAKLSISAKLPDNYPSNVIAGKEAIFAIEVKEVSLPILPEIDKEFIAKFGVSEGTETAFRAQIRENLEQEAESRVKSQLRHAVFSALLEDNDFDLPQALVEEEISRAIAERQHHMESHGHTHAHGHDHGGDEDVDREVYREEAVRRVRLALVIREAIRDREIKVEDSEVRKRVEAMASTYEDPRQVIDWYYGGQGRLAQIQGAMMEELLIESLMSEAKTVEKQVHLKDFMSPSPSSVEEA